MPSPVTHNPAKYPALAPPPRCLCAVYAASPVQAPAHIVSEEILIFLYFLPRLSRLSPKAQNKLEVGNEPA